MGSFVRKARSVFVNLSDLVSSVCFCSISLREGTRPSHRTMQNCERSAESNGLKDFSSNVENSDSR